MNKEEVKVKKLEIELEELKIEREKISHKNRMEQLEIRKEIAKLYRPKKKKKQEKYK